MSNPQEATPPSAIERGADLETSEQRLSLIVFSGELDRLLAAFVLATGAAASGMIVNMFFTFWGTTALRRPRHRRSKDLLSCVLGWMLPRGTTELPLSRLNFAGVGPRLIRRRMKAHGVASLDDLIALSGELGVRIRICEMSMNLLGLEREELIEYPHLDFCGVSTFIGIASGSKTTMFL